ncbi:unnamed protein product [Adineta steineri]|uniref:Uncharacterized protein n=1 Tax=Adineta steineri TaxID=433720 RepID=A0A814N341_9BILA|nr:unnamed protein product [Adineta steineri]CAF1514912.1 unnamed protein product [Adineta steineri]
MTTTIENLHNNKRKFISDNEIETSCNPKKIKSEQTSTSIVDVNDSDEMMICESFTSKENDTNKTDDITNKSQSMIIPKHCDGICNADGSPTSLIIRCYCDPYRLNSLIPYNSDIY